MEEGYGLQGWGEASGRFKEYVGSYQLALWIGQVEWFLFFPGV